MKFANREMKIDSIVSYFNQGAINLIPSFQRGSVWKLKDRQKLLENIIRVRPIPAIFLYKEPEGSRFEYNILDGKQRLESLILFVGQAHPEMKVKNVLSYFFQNPAAEEVDFKIEVEGKKLAFKDLEDSHIRAFREFAIATIEIDLDDESTSIDEVVDLFIDINQQGVKVSRFDVVKALGQDPLFNQMFGLISLEEDRKNSKYYKAKNNNFTFVLKRLNIVSRLANRNSQVDRMWERLTEIALFSRSGKHRAPAEILKAFIKGERQPNKVLSMAEKKKLRNSFDFLAEAYRSDPTIVQSKFATDQPQFYTVITTLLSTDLLEKFNHKDLTRRLAKLAKIFDGAEAVPAKLKKTVDEFRIDATKQTTHPARRAHRQDLLIKGIEDVSAG